MPKSDRQSGGSMARTLSRCQDPSPETDRMEAHSAGRHQSPCGRTHVLIPFQMLRENSQCKTEAKLFDTQTRGKEWGGDQNM